VSDDPGGKTNGVAAPEADTPVGGRPPPSQHGRSLMFVMTTCTCPAPAAGPVMPIDGRNWGPVHGAAIAAGDGMVVLEGGVDVVVAPVVVVGDACGALRTRAEIT